MHQEQLLGVDCQLVFGLLKSLYPQKNPGPISFSCGRLNSPRTGIVFSVTLTQGAPHHCLEQEEPHARHR